MNKSKGQSTRFLLPLVDRFIASRHASLCCRDNSLSTMSKAVTLLNLLPVWMLLKTLVFL